MSGETIDALGELTESVQALNEDVCERIANATAELNKICCEIIHMSETIFDAARKGR